MGSPALPATANRLLAVLPPPEADALAAHLEPVFLPVERVLYERDAPIEHVYFPTRGVVSMVSSMETGSIVEIATVGREGMVGIPIVLGQDTTTHRAFVQVPGEGVRIEVAAYRALLPRAPGLQALTMRYALALFAQIAACNRAHAVESRCARWLLMTHDRVQDTSFSLTQEFLAQMLGVRRPTVSIAAGMLQRAGLIDYVRGIITVTDRARLEAAACECYRRIRDEHERLLGSMEA
jgi:CRP-like cAMP-binding protein